jgi:hypothetical protein
MASRAGLAQANLPMTESSTDLSADFDAIAATGAKWVRFDFYWGMIQPTEASNFDWSAADRAVSEARSRGLNVLGTLAYTPVWARPANTTDHDPPTNPADYAAFAQAAAQRYAPQGVHAWEVWNEPNIAGFWQPAPDPVAYVTLLKTAYSAIKGADTQAVVLTGGTAPVGPTTDWVSADGTQMSAYHWIAQLYANGARGSFDAMATHPYNPAPNSPTYHDPSWGSNNYWNHFMETPQIYNNLMVPNGDGSKAIWGTEAGTHTGTSANSVSEDTQAQYVAPYISTWKSWPFTGPFFYYSLRDLGTNLANAEDNFGLLHCDRSQKPAYAAFKQAITS